MKSRVQCTRCDHFSLSFDPFSILSLPIPTSTSNFLTIKYFPYDMSVRPVEFTMAVGEAVTTKEIKLKINNYLEEVS